VRKRKKRKKRAKFCIWSPRTIPYHFGNQKKEKKDLFTCHFGLEKKEGRGGENDGEMEPFQ
jgi:hypothetical protein